MVDCRRALRRLLLGLMVAGVLGGAAAAPSFAFSENYCGYLIGEGTACSTVNGHTFYWNDVYYTGGGSLEIICQDMYNSSSGTRPGSSCNYNAVAVTNNYGATGTSWYARGYFWDHGANHTIYGYAETP